MSNRIRWAADSQNLAALEELAGIDFAMTYSDLFATHASVAAFRARMPGTQVLLGDRGLGDPTGLASWIDVERGARRPADVPGWLKEKRAHAVPGLTIYASLSAMSEVAAHAGETGWWRWYASWDAGLAVPGHPLAMLQFASDVMLGSDVDLSIIRQAGWPS